MLIFVLLTYRKWYHIAIITILNSINNFKIRILYNMKYHDEFLDGIMLIMINITVFNITVIDAIFTTRNTMKIIMKYIMIRIMINSIIS